MDLLTITDNLEKLNPTYIIRNAFNDSIVYEWHVGDEDRWVKISFLEQNEDIKVSFDLFDDEVEVSDCSALVMDSLQLVIELLDTLEFTLPMCSMPMQVQIQQIIKTLHETLDEEF